MNVRSVTEARKFDPSKAVKQNLFESERMFCDFHGLTPGQEQKLHAHEGCDKIYYVVEGCGHFTIGTEVREVGEKNVVYIPAGIPHGVRNNAATNLGLLVFMAPHPNYVSREVPS